MRYRLIALVATILPLAAAAAQQTAPTRPRFEAGADTNDARLYYDYGMRSLDDKPQESARAFYWASRLSPSSADALYALRVATLMAMTPDELGRYLDFSQSKRPAAYLAIDSMLFRAYTIDPFLQRRLERQLAGRMIEAAYVRANPSIDRVRLNEYVLNRMRGMRYSASVQAAEGRPGEALESYRKMLDDKNYTSKQHEAVAGSIHSERSLIFYRLGNLDSARAEMITAISLMRERDTSAKETVFFYQSKSVLDVLLGKVYERMNQPDQARESYQAALVEDLSSYGAHRSLAQVDMAKNDTAAALLEMDLAVQLQPDDPVLRYGYATMLVTARRDGDAAAQLKKSIAADPYYSSPYMLLARISDIEDYTDEAVSEYRQFVSLAPRFDAQLPAARARLAALTTAVASSSSSPSTSPKP
jgi:tetratricopeptide (TPR) repeat protein